MAKKTNKQVLIQINQEKSIFKTMEKRQIRIFWTHHQVKTTIKVFKFSEIVDQSLKQYTFYK